MTEIQETISEILALIHLLEPLLKKLEEHINIVERKNKNAGLEESTKENQT